MIDMRYNCKIIIKFSLILSLLHFVLLPVIFLPAPAKAEYPALTSTEMIENASALSNTTVSYNGEVIGDLLYRGDYAWINVSDGTNAISCYISATEADKIEYIGRYRIIGDAVSLTGTFHRACVEHGGDMDIHADKVIIDREGCTMEDNPSSYLLATSGILFICTLTAVILIWAIISRGNSRNSRKG